MKARVGSLLKHALKTINKTSDMSGKRAVAAAFGGGASADELPVVIQIPLIKPHKSEDWKAYQARVQQELEPLASELKDLMGIESALLIVGNGLQAFATPDQVGQLGQHHGIELLELDPHVKLTTMNDVPDDLDYGTFHAQHPTLDGSGVTVAVLDSGVDAKHPYLTVSDAVSTCGESVDIPGEHGTHCAGSIASSDSSFRGVAPAVSLLNIKVLRADGSGKNTFITRGIDEALDRDAHP